MILLGNPLLWWSGVLTLMVVIMGSPAPLDQRTGLVLAGYFVVFGPWVTHSSRIIFTFYTVVIPPFVVLVAIYTLGVMMGQQRTRSDKSWVGRCNLVSRSFPTNQVQICLGLFIVALIFLVVVYFFPVWTGMTMPQHQSYWRM